jgi:hypothetical protein
VNSNTWFHITFSKMATRYIFLLSKHWMNINNLIPYVLLECCKMFPYSITVLLYITFPQIVSPTQYITYLVHPTEAVIQEVRNKLIFCFSLMLHGWNIKRR